MDHTLPVDPDRRQLITATAVAAAIPAVASVGTLVSTFQPSERARAAGAAVELDIGDLAPGEMKTIEWRGKPVWVLRRTREMLASLAQTEDQVADPLSARNMDEMTPPYARNKHRSINPEYLVVIGICTHLGCSPTSKFAAGPQPSLPDDWAGGFFCPCHGSTFDLAGRVFANKPAPDNLQVPRHMYLGPTRLAIGRDEEGEA